MNATVPFASQRLEILISSLTFLISTGNSMSARRIWSAAKNWIAENLERGRSTLFAADNGSQLLGFTQLYPALCSVDLVDYFVLYDLYVIEAARRQGIARALMNAASDWAKAQGADRLDLETARDNAPGQALYRDLGYELDEVFLKFSLDLSD